MLLPLQGALTIVRVNPGRCPGLGAGCPFRARQQMLQQMSFGFPFGRRFFVLPAHVDVLPPIIISVPITPHATHRHKKILQRPHILYMPLQDQLKKNLTFFLLIMRLFLLSVSCRLWVLWGLYRSFHYHSLPQALACYRNSSAIITSVGQLRACRLCILLTLSACVNEFAFMP